MAQLDAYLKALEIGLPIKQLRFKEQQARQEQQREREIINAFQSIYGDSGKTVYLFHKSGIPLEDIEKTMDIITPERKRQALQREQMGWQSAEKAQVAERLLKRMGVPQEGIDAILEQIYNEALPEEERVKFPLTASQIVDFYKPTKTEPTAEQRNLQTRWGLTKELGGLGESVFTPQGGIGRRILTPEQRTRKGFLESELGEGQQKAKKGFITAKELMGKIGDPNVMGEFMNRTAESKFGILSPYEKQAPAETDTVYEAHGMPTIAEREKLITRINAGGFGRDIEGIRQFLIQNLGYDEDVADWLMSLTNIGKE